MDCSVGMIVYACMYVVMCTCMRVITVAMERLKLSVKPNIGRYTLRGG